MSLGSYHAAVDCLFSHWKYDPVSPRYFIGMLQSYIIYCSIVKHLHSINVICMGNRMFSHFLLHTLDIFRILIPIL